MKSDIERGAFGSWAFHARDLLDLTVEEVADRLGYHPASLRKVEAGGAPASRRLKRDLPKLYREIAETKLVALPPLRQDEPQEVAPDDLAAAIRELVEEVRLGRLAQERTEDRLNQMLAALVHVAVGAEAWSRIQTELGVPAAQGTD